MGDHREHQPGTRSECRQCTALAYEPGWYASLITWSQGGGATPIGLATTVTT
ncbi:MAG TPA: hypothetical protein VG993_09300 [Actinomycetota bacterium]|jgi:hypothetical protein|nr:hypothetical protein [Actinomycetota bacterium]